MKFQELLDSHTLIIIDASCVLCHGFSRFVIQQDTHMRCRFGALQDERVASLLEGYTGFDSLVDSIGVIYQGVLYQKSSAVLHVITQLPWYRQRVRLGYLLPVGVRDRLYDRIARKRIGWFGKTENCDLRVTREISKRLVKFI